MSVKVHEAFCLDSFQDRLLFFDDFEGDQIKDEWRGTGDAGGGADVIDLQTGGICRLDTGIVVDDDWLIDWFNIRSLLVTKKVTMEARVKTNQNTYLKVYIALRFDGLNDIYFYCFDNFGGAHNWQIACVDAGAGAGVDTGVAVDTNYHLFRIECFPTGEVHFYIDNVECANSPVTTNITAQYLQPVFSLLTRTTEERTMDIDYCYIRQER